ncbi:protein kinase family protein [Cellulomonas chitinilytica]|uniref:protein kinase family protein n=1 Tax=Cellulomonas chitinilytica TaxID=398759 RepID=UPI001945AFC3|nr:protein kinase family protein [Cellulomonas chitinilytica]
MNEAVGRGTVLAGRYRVVQPVASDLVGSSAWQATDQILDRPVRVRVLESGAVAPALDAARRAALVTDPRLVRVLDVGTHEGVGYVVTEQVSGPSLAELVARGPLGADQARAIVGEAASALEVARRRGVHHLALRPSALHVSPDGRVMLSGLALDAALRGEPSGDARATTRADTVGLVRLLYTALTGRWPADPRQPWPTGDGPAQAPVHEGSPVPPVDLVPSVPADLDTLCAVTLGPYEDGPHSPGELVRELEPWGELQPVPASAPPTVVAPPLVEEPVFVDHDSQDTAPVRVQRQSARTAFDELQAPGANLPGTPPPAAPTRTSAFGAATAGAAAGAAAGAVAGAEAGGYVAPPAPPAPLPGAGAGATTPMPPVGATAPMPPATFGAAPPSPYGQPQPPTGYGPPPAAYGQAPAGYGQAPPAAYGPVPPGAPQGALHQSAPASFGPPNGYQGHVAQGPVEEPLDFDGFAVEDVPAAPTRRRFDPTALVLGIVAVVVVIGVIIAFKSLFSSFDPQKPSTDDAASAPEASASAPAQAAPPSAEPSQPAAPPAGGVPTIATAITIDPSDEDGEHEEDAAKAYDGDPSTFWYTQTYKRDDFAGFKDGVGYAITLTAPAHVKTVTLHSNSTGGHVEVRATDATAPTTGPVLASGAFGPETVLTLDPATDTQSIVLWVTQLPTAPDGGFRLELTEISLS